MLRTILKYSRPSNYYHYALEKARHRFPNLIVDRLLRASEWAELPRALKACGFDRLDLSSEALRQWAAAHYPAYLDEFGDLAHKKLVEFFASFRLLAPGENDVFLDVAGGDKGYMGRLNCRRKILHDLKISPATRGACGPSFDCIESDAGAIPLPDESIDCMACHHSFEHFKGDSDIRFVREVQRLLKAGGRCCIVPVFISDVYSEITDQISWRYKFDDESRRIIDPTASTPGGVFSGNYARVYDAPAFMRRIVGNIDLSRFALTLVDIRLDRKGVPDMALGIHGRIAGIEHPYRALVIRRTAKADCRS